MNYLKDVDPKFKKLFESEKPHLANFFLSASLRWRGLIRVINPYAFGTFEPQDYDSHIRYFCYEGRQYAVISGDRYGFYVLDNTYKFNCLLSTEEGTLLMSGNFAVCEHQEGEDTFLLPIAV